MTDADVEHLRRAMVEAHATWRAIGQLFDPDRGLRHGVTVPLTDALTDAHEAWEDAAHAYVEAKRARGAL